MNVYDENFYWKVSKEVTSFELKKTKAIILKSLVLQLKIPYFESTLLVEICT